MKKQNCRTTEFTQQIKPQLNLVCLKNYPIYQQLQLEEALLRTDSGNWCLINIGSPPAIVMGISGDFDTLIDRNRVELYPIDIIRRFSGGGTVVVDHNTLFVSLICNQADVGVNPFPNPILCFAGSFFHPLLNDHGFQIRENDYVLGERKFGGNAQYITKNRWVHHTTLLWDFCPEKMSYLKIPSKMPQYRQSRHHNDFLCCLSDYIQEKDSFIQDLIKELGATFNLKDTSLFDAELALKSPHRKAVVVLQ